jgi:hypothetical protein
MGYRNTFSIRYDRLDFVAAVLAMVSVMKL